MSDLLVEVNCLAEIYKMLVIFHGYVGVMQSRSFVIKFCFALLMIIQWRCINDIHFGGSGKL